MFGAVEAQPWERARQADGRQEIEPYHGSQKGSRLTDCAQGLTEAVTSPTDRPTCSRLCPSVMAWMAAEDKRRGPCQPCPCGSGREFRFCHGDSAPRSPFSGVTAAMGAPQDGRGTAVHAERMSPASSGGARRSRVIGPCCWSVAGAILPRKVR